MVLVRLQESKIRFMYLVHQLNLEAGTFLFFLHYWIQYISVYLKPKSINKLSDHLLTTVVPGAVENFTCVDLQVGMGVTLSLQKTKLVTLR